MAGWGMLALAFLTVPALALEYPTHEVLTRQLERIAREHPDLVRLHSLAESAAHRTVWQVEVGAGTDAERSQRPALLLVAGMEGNDLAGTVSAVTWIERLAADFGREPGIRRLLETTTLYVFPRLNPDAAESYFARPQTERMTDDTPVDDDHDGLADEDGPEDINGDGLITQMRIEDAGGDYRLDPTDARLLLKADPAKGETGQWRLMTEGKDNDHDEAWNEDGSGGVNFNRNFPFNYQFFAPTSGRFPVSESITKALADFVIAHPNIGIVFTFGQADNLVQVPKSEAGGKRPPEAIHAEDLPYYRELGQHWRELLGLKKELKGQNAPGTFSDWMYFHRGRLSLTAQAWSPALQLERAKAEQDKTKASGDIPPSAPKEDKPAAAEKSTADTKKPESGNAKKSETDNRNAEERAFLEWLGTHAPDQSVPWTAIEHPDFPGQRVEVGGLAPFAKSNPPAAILEDWVEAQGRFLTELAGKLPRIGIRSTKVKHLGAGVYDLTVQVENTGYLPTLLAQGSETGEIHPTRVVLDVANAALLAGTRTTTLGMIAGSGGMKEVRWIVRAAAKSIAVEVVSMLGGRAQATIVLKKDE